jgi:Relaxase/Mobilisation nuclease domain
MIPHIAQRGHSFKGAGMYYLHDKHASTSERVGWTVTRNLPTQDAEMALKCMAYMDVQARREREESGRVGRKQTAGNVFAYSLSWHPDQQPDAAEMRRAAEVSLARLGLWEHQAVLVAHSDTAHAHVHVIVNLVHPDTHKVADLSYSKRKLQEWASEYEHEDGVIYCEERERNAERRKNGERTKYQDERLPAAPSITELYQQTDSGKAFVAALAEQGYTLAHGDRGRLVIVDADGVVQNLVRQIDGAKKRDIEAKLGEVLESLPTLAEAQRERAEAEPRPAPAAQEQEEKEVSASMPAKRVEIAHMAAVGRLPRGDRANSDGSGEPAVRVLEGEQERSATGDMRIRAVHYGEVGVYHTPTHAEYMEQHRQVQARREVQEAQQDSPAPLWREVIAGVCRVSQSFMLAVVRDAMRHPEQFNAQMQRVNEHLQVIGQRVASASRALWDSVTLQEQRGQYLARVRRQYMDYDRDEPERQVSAASLALVQEYEDRER